MGAVVARRARDEVHALGLAVDREVAPGELGRGVDGVAAAGGRGRPARRGPGRARRGARQVERGTVGEVAEDGRSRASQLVADRVGDLRPPVADVRRTRGSRCASRKRCRPRPRAGRPAARSMTISAPRTACMFVNGCQRRVSMTSTLRAAHGGPQSPGRRNAAPGLRRMVRAGCRARRARGGRRARRARARARPSRRAAAACRAGR